MSSTVGIGLTPDYPGPGPVVYSWNTTYGYFVSWNAPDFRVIQYNAQHRNYRPNDITGLIRLQTWEEKSRR